MSQNLSVIIVGGGLGGLATAIGLQRVGHHVVILEKAPVLGDVRCSITTAYLNNVIFLLKFADRSRNSDAT